MAVSLEEIQKYIRKEEAGYMFILPSDIPDMINDLQFYSFSRYVEHKN